MFRSRTNFNKRSNSIELALKSQKLGVCVWGGGGTGHQTYHIHVYRNSRLNAFLSRFLFVFLFVHKQISNAKLWVLGARMYT